MSETEQNKSLEASENTGGKKLLWAYGLIPVVLAAILLSSLPPRKGQEPAEMPVLADFEGNLPEMDIKITWNVSEANLVGLLKKYGMAFYAPTAEVYRSLDGDWNCYVFKDQKTLNLKELWPNWSVYRETASQKEIGHRLLVDLEKAETELQGLEPTDPDYIDTRIRISRLKSEATQSYKSLIYQKNIADIITESVSRHYGNIGPGYGDMPDEIRKAMDAALPPDFGGKVDQGILLLGSALLVANDAVSSFAKSSGREATQGAYEVQLLFTQNGEVVAESVKEREQP